ncbi:MAG: threonine 3-dehydrogenase [Chloroflexi bacterium]|jgi:nucleoside-diphosphate-sugar epimerase|nr:MAG: threonine 3-dehydrogenase [Chloroflexota bacterium]
MTVLLIGSGVVGSQIANILVEQGTPPVILDYSPQPEALADNVDASKVTVVRGDIMNPFDLTRAMQNHEITSIIHTAAYPMLTVGAQANPYAAVQINVVGTLNVLEAARTFGIERVVIVSSGVLTGQMAGGGDDGDAAKEEAFPRPTTFYAATKQAAESLGVNYAKWCNIDLRAVRYAAIAGPWRGAGGGEPSNTFRSLVQQAVDTGAVNVPARSLEWVYSKDAAMGTVLALQSENLTDRIFNIGSGVMSDGEDMATAFTTAMPDVAVRVQETTLPPELQPRTQALDLSRSRAQLGYDPQYDLAGAVADFAGWYRKQKK